MNKKKKRNFKMPHLLYIMLGLLIMMSLLTYVIPAGNFGRDASGKVDASVFNYLSSQTPVSLVDLFFMLLGGLVAAGTTVWVVMVSAANMNVVMDTGAVDEVLEYATIKLKKSSTKVLVPILYFLILYIAAFASTDALIAVVPIGVLFAKRLKIDPLSALGVSFFPSMIGFGLGPTLRVIIPQTMLNLPPLSGFGMRMLLLNIFGIVGLLYTFRYIKRVQKDSNNSLMHNEDWKNELIVDDVNKSNMDMPKRSVIVLILMILQYVILVAYFLIFKEKPMEFIVGFFLIGAIFIGLVGGMNADEVANSFVRGLANMAFVVFIIGLATTMQTVMVQGNILDTIIFSITRPLMNLNRSISAIGITAVITLINPFVPSVTAKAAALIPIIEPLTNALGIHPQIACQAFLMGDSFTNMISPALGWTMGALTIAKVPYDRWIKWVIKPMLLFVFMSFIVIYILNTIGWTGI